MFSASCLSNRWRDSGISRKNKLLTRWHSSSFRNTLRVSTSCGLMLLCFCACFKTSAYWARVAIQALVYVLSCALSKRRTLQPAPSRPSNGYTRRTPDPCCRTSHPKTCKTSPPPNTVLYAPPTMPPGRRRPRTKWRWTYLGA
jgi:hypothetical protein